MWAERNCFVDWSGKVLSKAYACHLAPDYSKNQRTLTSTASFWGCPMQDNCIGSFAALNPWLSMSPLSLCPAQCSLQLRGFSPHYGMMLNSLWMYELPKVLKDFFSHNMRLKQDMPAAFGFKHIIRPFGFFNWGLGIRKQNSLSQTPVGLINSTREQNVSVCWTFPWISSVPQKGQCFQTYLIPNSGKN